MSNIEKAIERIKILECPTGELENRVVEILEEYNAANRDVIAIKKEQEDENDLETYIAEIAGDEHRITILVESGLDDYVAAVVDAYIN